MLEEKRVNLKTGEQKLFRKKHKGSGLRGRPESPERPQRRCEERRPSTPPLPAAAVTTGGCAPRPRPRAGGHCDAATRSSGAVGAGRVWNAVLEKKQVAEISSEMRIRRQRFQTGWEKGEAVAPTGRAGGPLTVPPAHRRPRVHCPCSPGLWLGH